MKKQSRIINSAAGVYLDGEIQHIEYFVGNEKDTVQWINKTYSKLSIKSFFKKRIYFCIDYADEVGEMYWKPYDVLIEEGVFVL